MTWDWLGIVPAIRSLRLECAGLRDELDTLNAEMQALVTEKALLADRLEMALNDRARVWDVMKEALAGERIAYQTQINIDTQRQYGIAPYPQAPKLPESRVPQQQDGGPISGRMSAGQAVQQATANFVQEFKDRIKSDLKQR